MGIKARKMKNHILLVTMLIIFGSFINKERALPIHKNNKAVQSINKPITGNTLDSLQGTWISTKDPSSKIMISRNKMYTYYDAECIDSSNIFLTSDLSGKEIGNYNVSGVKGQYLILYHVGYTNYDIYYTIGYLSNISLELIFEGKLLAFTKQKVQQ